MTGRFRFLLAAFALLAGPASAQTCNLAPAGSLNQQVTVLRACLRAAVDRNNAQDQILGGISSQSAAIRDLSLSVDSLSRRVGALKAWRPNVEASLADLRDRLDALEAGAGTGGGGPQAAIEPNTDDGRPITQIGVWYTAYWSAVRPFLNELQANTPRPDPWYFLKQDGTGATQAEIIAADAVDPATMYPRAGKVGAAPAPFSRVNLGTVVYQARFFPAEYTGRWVLTWEGQGTPTIAGLPAPVVVTANRREYDLTFTAVDETLTVPRVEFTDVGAGFGDVRFFRKTDEAKILAGQVYTDQFLAMVRRYKIVRLMDWNDQGSPWFKASQLRPLASRGWAQQEGGEQLSDYRWADPANPRTYQIYGVPLEAQFGLAVATDTALWLNVSPFLGMQPAAFAYWNPSNAYEQRFAIGGPAIAAQASAQIASTEWDLYADKIVAAAAANYPRTRMLYIELGNEFFNQANPFFNAKYAYDRLGEGLFPSGGAAQHHRVAGWVSARLAEAINGALARAGRSDQRWTLGLAGQNARPVSTTEALEGFRDYFLAKSVDPAPWLARVGVSASTYFEGAFEPGGAFADLDNADETARRKAISARIEADPVAAANRIVDWFINDVASGKLTLPNVFTLQQQHRVIAQSFGARLINPYEGGDHEGLAKFWGEPYVSRPGYITMANLVRFGEPGRRLTAKWVEFGEADGAVTNYAGPGWYPALNATKFDSWHDAAYGQTTGRETALAPVLRPAQ